MLNENSTLASIAYVLADTLSEVYGLDPADVFDGSGIDCWRSFQPGERVSVNALDAVWQRASDLTADPYVGLKAGRRIEPGHFHAFGYSWLASESLLGAMKRLCRYHLIISTAASKIAIERVDDGYRVLETYPRPASIACREAGDFGIGAVLRLAELGVGRQVRPLSAEILFDDASMIAGYEELLGCRVIRSNDRTALNLAQADMEAEFSGAVPEVASATDRIADRYLESLDTSKITAQVRQLLIDFLPSGNAHQDRVAATLHRSPSTLQRQLQSEGTSYREVLEDTRSVLAKDYLRDGKYSHAQIAYLLGFSDQSNFSRAFKRWTGCGPREFQDQQIAQR